MPICYTFPRLMYPKVWLRKDGTMIYKLSQKTQYLVLSIFLWAFLTVSFSAFFEDIPKLAETGHSTYSITVPSLEITNVLAEFQTKISLVKNALIRNSSNRSISNGRNIYVALLTCFLVLILTFFAQTIFAVQQTVYNSHLFIILFIHDQDGLKG